MDNQKNIMIFLIVTAFVFLVGGMVLANKWVSGEIDQATQVSRSPQIVIEPKPVNELRKPRKNTFQRQVLEIDRAPRMEEKIIEPVKAPTEKKKSDKIIYEIPLDDLILVQ